jgi:hypothetical protein
MPRNTRHVTGENGQIFPFFILTILLLGLMLAVSLQIGRIVYARGEVGKAADAAALAAASQLDLVAYRETGQILFLPNTPVVAQDYAMRNAGFLAKHEIVVSVSHIWVGAGSQLVYVTVVADLGSLLPGFLSHRGNFGATGYAQARIQGGP